ncbi:ras suppressor protein 1 [Platysternon megacephalum]|uniref:Ras suppressor protein 1 n=1 Tax=Platysternon megacephalum TaxID=55544 RepID=A0A4D9EEH3_9SAUR|nr:ras suppressor protein 1 [Platysternon megacephalum]
MCGTAAPVSGILRHLYAWAAMTLKEMHFDDGPNALAVGLQEQPGLEELLEKLFPLERCKGALEGVLHTLEWWRSPASSAQHRRAEV